MFGRKTTISYVLLAILCCYSLLIIPPIYGQTYEWMSATASQQSYKYGDTIVISGQVSKIIQDKHIVIRIIHQGQLVHLVTMVSVSADGRFTYAVDAVGSQWQNDGTYLVRASYTSANKVETTFELFFTESQTSKIPDWVRNIFIWYGEGQIGEEDLLNALQYLIDSKIITVSETNENVNNNIVISSEYTIKDEGDFYVTYYENPNSIYDPSAKEWIQGEEYFEYQIEYLNSIFRLPHDVEIVVSECNEVNAFYDYTTKQITMCYEFMDSVFSDFETYYFEEGLEVTDEQLSIENLDVVDFVFYHELGHALVDIYQLPITGLEENVVDQFAALIMLLTENVDDYEGIVAQDILYSVGTWFFIQANLGYEHVYWDVHNLDIQRFYNISCYAYGQNPQYNADLITNGDLPEERAENCAYEYAVLEDSWNRILSPYFI